MTARKQSSSLQSYLDDAGNLPRDVLLGHVVMYSVGDGEYDRDAVVKWYAELDLNPAHIPMQNRAVDAYKKATSKLDDYEYQTPDGNTAHVLIRDVSNDKNQVVRHLIREVTNNKQRRLAYAQVGEAVFYRPTTSQGKVVPGTERMRITLDASTFQPHERDLVVDVAHKIEHYYERYLGSMDDMKVRAMLRDYVSSLNAVQLRSGVYFVHVSRQDDLMKLQELARRMATQAGTKCFVWLMPLVDLEEQREMVIEAFQTEAEKSLNGITAKISSLREARKTISADAYAKIKDEYDQLMKQAVEYTRTLDINQDRTAGAAEVALTSLIGLQQQMLRDTERSA